MAIVNIPFGGQTVGIEIPDFALETTQRDIFDLTRDQLSTLQAIEAELSGQSAALKNLNTTTSAANRDRSVTDNLRENTDATRKGNQKLLDGFKAFQGAFEEQKASELASGLLSAAGLGGAAAVVGTVIGIIEKFGEAVSKTVRVGVGLGESIEDLKNASADVGITLDQFSAIIATNGEMLRTLADNTGDGAFAAIQLTRQFQQLTQAQGHYGMGSDEILQLLLEEAEMRRQTVGTLFLEENQRAALAQSVAENIAQNTALARITGQDVRERMAARRAMEQNVIAQSYLTGQTDQVRERLGRFSESLAGLPGGAEVTNAFIESISTGIDFRSANPELFAIMGQPAEELFNFLNRASRDPSMSMEEFDVQLLSMIDNLRDVAPGMEEQLRIMARGGNQNAALILAMQNQFREFGSIEEIRTAYQTNRAAIEDGGELAAAGINVATDRLTASINNAATQLALELLPGETSSAGSILVDSINGLANMINEGSGFVSDAFDFMRYLNPFGLDMSFPNPAEPFDTSAPAESMLPPTPDETSATPTVPGAETPASEGGPVPVAFTPDDFRTAVIQAFMEVMASGGLPVDVRNWGQMPRPSPFTTT